MTDHELLELAAKAAGLTFWEENEWNPLTDDGHALRLAVKLELSINRDVSSNFVFAYHEYGIWTHQVDRTYDDPYAATRRAIVRAAAEIGRSKHDE